MTTTLRARRRGLLLAAVLALITGLIGVTGDAFAATLFSDDFEDGNATGWTTSGGSWSITSDGSGVYRQSGTSANARALAGATGWTNDTVTARIKPTAFNGGDRYVALLSRAQSTTSYYYLALRSTNAVELGKVVGGAATPLASATLTVATGTWYTLSLQASGTALTGQVGTVTVSASDSQFATGQIGLATYYAAANIDDVIVTDAAGPTPTTPTTVAPTSATPTTPATTPASSPATTPASTPTSTPVVTPTALPPAPTDTPTGFAGVTALGQATTTGGTGGPNVLVSTADQLIDYMSRTGPYVIWVLGTITLPTGGSDGMYHITSDKTILGLGTTARIENGGFTIGLPVDDAVTTVPADAVHNIIIRNLSFAGASDDAINVQMFSHHIWIDHNDLCCGGDGLVDIKRGSDFITVSWNRTHDHNKTMLLGHDDANGPQDIGHLRVTYHHNFFDGSDQRNPRVRFGEPVHIFNNYCRNASYCIVSAMDAGLMVENNYFDTVNNPGRVDFSGDLGRLVARGNIVVNCHHDIEVRGTVVEPSTYYAYSLDAAADVPTIVPAGAGVGKIGI